MGPEPAKYRGPDDGGGPHDGDPVAKLDRRRGAVDQHAIPGADIDSFGCRVGVQAFRRLLDFNGAGNFDASHDPPFAVSRRAKTSSLVSPNASRSTRRCVVGSSSVNLLSAHRVSRKGTSLSASWRMRWRARPRRAAQEAVGFGRNHLDRRGGI